jgi:hypothetical protein
MFFSRTAGGGAAAGYRDESPPAAQRDAELKIARVFGGRGLFQFFHATFLQCSDQMVRRRLLPFLK